MMPNPTEFRRNAIAPMECIKEGWALIKHQYWLFFGISIVGLLIGGLVPIVLLGPVMVGIFLCLQRRQRNQPVEFSLLFKGFDQFVAGLIVAVLKVLPIFILMVPYYIFVFAVMATGFAKLTCCQPEAVSLVKVAEASSVPVLLQRLPTCVPVLAALL